MDTTNNQTDSILELYCGDILLGVLSHIELFDWPWYQADFKATPEFEQYRSLFDEELRLLESEGATEAFLLVDAKIEALQLTLVDPQTAKSTQMFGLHIEGQRARLRPHFD